MIARTFCKLICATTLTLQAQVHLSELKEPGNLRIIFYEIDETEFRRLAGEPWKTKIEKDTIGKVVRKYKVGKYSEKLEILGEETTKFVYVWEIPEKNIEGIVKNDIIANMGGEFAIYDYLGYVVVKGIKIPVFQERFGMQNTDAGGEYILICFRGCNCKSRIEIPLGPFWVTTEELDALPLKDNYLVLVFYDAIYVIEVDEENLPNYDLSWFWGREISYGVSKEKWFNLMTRIGGFAPVPTIHDYFNLWENPKIYSVKGTRNACVIALAARPGIKGIWDGSTELPPLQQKYIYVKWEPKL